MSGSTSSAAAATTVMAHPSPATKYEVFLSFRGVDTRNSFTTYLHDKLVQKKIKTFIDYNIDRGNKISDELYTGIEESMIYVIIFSQNYASSAWCLKELVKIWECKERYGRHVIPVFYKVEPATIKYQKGSYGKAFAAHINQKWFDEEEIKSWKVALNNAAELKGTSVDDTRPEIKVVDGIVEDIVKKLNRSFSSTDDQGMVGIDKHIAQMESLLQLEPVGVQIIGIWGMGGIGKTTLARALYNKLATKFSSSCCILHAQKEIERAGIDSLRAKILSELLDNEAIPSNGLHYAIERVKRTKILLILDDLKDSDQLKELVGRRGNFGQGSRIIVTSRDKQALQKAEEDKIYQVTNMSDEDSLRLFSLNAFKQNPSVKTYKTLVERVLEYAQGVPLVLDVLGRLLCGKSIKVWESELKKLQKFPHLEIFNVLKLSYDGLDDEEKEIFLEIVCFYVGQLEDIALDLLDGCGFSAHIGMDVLKDRGLISILNNRIMMHDQILEMGLQIVSQQRVNKNPRKHVGLCKYGEIYNKQGTDAIHFLDVSNIKEYQLDPEPFKNMPSLRILYFFKYTLFRKGQSNVNLPPTFLESLPDGLQILCWEGFPLTSLLLGPCRKNLVKLYMRNSHLKQLWEDDQDLPNLKRLDLSSSSNLIQIPDLFKFPNIEEIIIRDCEKLTQVNSERDLPNLKRLDLSSSLNLIQIPDLFKFPNIEEIILRDCEKLTQVNSERDLPNLKRLDLSSSSNLNQIPDLFKFPNIEEIILRDCGKLTQVNSERDLPNLKRLDLSSSSNLNQIPDLFKFPNIEEIILRDCEKLTHVNSERDLPNLKRLELSSSSNLNQIPDLFKFPNIEEIILRDCEKLTHVNSERDLPNLKRLDLSSSSNLTQIPDLFKFPNIEEIILRDCEKLTQVNSERDLPNLKRLDLSYSSNLIEIPDLSKFPNIEEIILNSCTSLTQVHSSSFLSKLQCLWFNNCFNLTSLNLRSNILSRSSGLVGLYNCGRLKKLSIRGFSEAKEIYDDARLLDVEYSNDLGKLRGITPSGFIHELCWLDLNGCQSLTSLPADLCKLKLLRRLYLKGCSNLDEFPEIKEPMENLAVLCLAETTIQELPPSLHRLVGLEELNLHKCKRLEIIPSSIGRLTKLCKLYLIGCESLETFPSSIFKLKLTELDLTGCSKLKTFPEILELAESFSCISLGKTAIKELPSSFDRLVGLEELNLYCCARLEVIPSSIGTLTRLCKLDLRYCKSLETFPSSIFKLKLTELNLIGCSKLKTFPEILEPAESFSCISLGKTAIKELPSSFDRLVGLEELNLYNCKRLEIIPSSIGRLTKLCKLYLVGCESLETFPSSIFKLKLTELDLTGCSKLKTFPEILEHAESFSCISLENTAIKELPSSFDRLVGLEELNLYCCARLEVIPSSIGTFSTLCKLDLRYCKSLETFPSSIFKLELTELNLIGCSKLKTFPEILEPAESFSCISLGKTAIKELPSSFDRLVGLEELNLYNCKRLEIIPSSIGRLTKLCKLYLIGCESLETFPSSIFKLKLTELDLTGCSKLKTFPEILEPAESFTHIGLRYTAIKELPSSLDRLVGLQTLCIASNDLESLPNNIGNLNLLSCLDLLCSGKLTEIPNDIGRLSSSLTELSLINIGIVSLPESIAHLSRLESLDVSWCKKLECIPALPPSMKKLMAFSCPSITRVVLNPPDSKVGTFIFNLTNNGEHNPSVHCIIVEDARLRIIEGAYRSVYYCFPGSAVPHWFPYNCEGNSLTVDKDSPNWCHDNRVTGFVVCAVLQYPKCDYLRFSLTYESDGRTHELPYDNLDQLRNSLKERLCLWEDDRGFHTFLWKYDLMDSASIDKGTFHALKLTFKTSTLTVRSNSATVERCGICPLYTKGKK